jgi:hypothetical protein
MIDTSEQDVITEKRKMDRRQRRPKDYVDWHEHTVEAISCHDRSREHDVTRTCTSTCGMQR